MTQATQPNTAFDGLNPASYTIKVKDALGCEFTQVVVIPQVMEVGLTSDDAFGCTTPQEQITMRPREEPKYQELIPSLGSEAA